jgi:hypothetical protein
MRQNGRVGQVQKAAGNPRPVKEIDMVDIYFVSVRHMFLGIAAITP